MTALEIYQQDISDQQSGTLQPRQQYYTQLRDALYQELMQQGYSELLDQLLKEIRGRRLEKIYVVDFAVLMECHSMIVLGRKLRDASNFVPHLQMRGRKITWDTLDQPGSFLMQVPRDMVDKLRQLRSVSRQLVDVRDDTVLPQADDAAQREIKQVHALNKLLNERCKGLEKEREALRERIRSLEEGVISEQVRNAIEARRIQEEEALRQSCEEQKGAAKEAFRAQFATEQDAQRLRWEDAERQFAAVRDEAAKESAAVRQGVATDLRQLTDLLEAKINDWNHGLDRTECRMLANCYVALHDLLTRPMAQLVLDAQCAGTDEAVLASMTAVQGTLQDRVHQLEQAMSRLGLVVIRPEEGAAFDGAYHLAAGTSAGAAEDAVIARCVHPGVMAQGAAEAMVKAEVELK